MKVNVTHSNSLAASEALAAMNAEAPRVSLKSMEDKIVASNYFTIGEAVAALSQPTSEELNIITVCVLRMENGFVLLGKSAPASAANFDPVKGQTFAYEDAINQLWTLEGYLLKTKLFANKG